MGERFAMDDGYLTALPAHHTVPAVAYRLEGPTGSLVFSGDTSSDEAFWQAVLASPDLRHLLIECAFPDEESRLAGTGPPLQPQPAGGRSGATASTGASVDQPPQTHRRRAHAGAKLLRWRRAKCRRWRLGWC